MMVRVSVSSVAWIAGFVSGGLLPLQTFGIVLDIRDRAEKKTAYLYYFFFRTNVTFGFHFSGSLSLNESMSCLDLTGI